MEDANSQRSRPSQAWDDFILSTRPDIGFMQASWWADVMASQGWGHFGAIFKDGESILGGARVLTSVFQPGKCFYYIPDGPILPEKTQDAEALLNAMLDFIDRKRQQQPELVTHLRLEPKWTERPAFVKRCRDFDGWLEPRSTLHVDLTPTIDDILAQMKPKGRYNINLARKRGVQVIEDTSPEGVETFLEIYGATMERKGTELMGFDYLRTLIATLRAQDCGGLFFAEYEGIRLATVLAIFFGDRATYFFGGSRPVHRNLMAPYLIHFEIMKRAKSRGQRIYDFYGVASPGEDDHMWADISTFKRKFGGRYVQFIPALDLVYDEAGYQAYLT